MDRRLAARSRKDRALGWWLGLLLFVGAVLLLMLPVKYQHLSGLSNDADTVLGVGYETRWDRSSAEPPFVRKGDSLGSALFELQQSAALTSAETDRLNMSLLPLIAGAFLLGRYARREQRAH